MIQMSVCQATEEYNCNKINADKTTLSTLFFWYQWKYISFLYIYICGVVCHVESH